MAYRVIIAFYGLINIAGGLMAFLSPSIRSEKSLIVGGISGLMLLSFAYIAKSNPGLAFRGAAALAFALGAFWVFRINELVAQGKPTTMAIGNLALAVVVFVVLGAGHMLASRARKATSE